MNVSYDFRDEVAIITGAARGVGRSMVAAFVAAGLPGRRRRPGRGGARADLRATRPGRHAGPGRCEHGGRRGRDRCRGGARVRQAEFLRQQRRRCPAHEPAGGDRPRLGHRLRGQLPRHLPDDPARRPGADRPGARRPDHQFLLRRLQPGLGRSRRLRQQPGRYGELQQGRGHRARAARDPGELRQPRPHRHPAQAAAAVHGREPRAPHPGLAAGQGRASPRRSSAW